MKTMKTSNKLIAAAFLLILLSLFVYDRLLIAEYLSGRYKDPYRDFTTLKFKDFDAVGVISTNAANVKFIQGPFSVRIDTNFLNYVKVKQAGKRLQINTVFESNYLYNPNPYILVISCPKLSEVCTNATYRSNNQQVTDTIVREDWKMRQVLIDGFKQDSLTIKQDYGSTVVLANNQIHSINGVIGTSKKSGSKLIIEKSNQFQDVNLDIRNKSSLLLNDAFIHNLTYHLADSAKLVLIGNAQNLIKNSNPSQK
ncbi:MAG: hypothetical protein JWQ63_3370 [Mucilaginibacter sp.]|nr:hypothetical protein [Mucilaginibacter sp.]